MTKAVPKSFCKITRRAVEAVKKRRGENLPNPLPVLRSAITWAPKMSIANLANSEGWNWKGPKPNHL